MIRNLGNRNLNKKSFIVNEDITITLKFRLSAIAIIVLAFTSIILITGSPFQLANNLIENNGALSIKIMGQVYGEEDEDDGDDDGGRSNDSGEGFDDSSDESEDYETDDEEQDLPEHYTETSQGIDEDIADLEDDLYDADSNEERERIGVILDEAREQSDK